MARRKQEEWKVDEWDDSLDLHPAGSSDSFRAPEQGKTFDADWDDFPPEGQKSRKYHASRKPGNKKLAAILFSAAAAVILAVVILIVTGVIGGGGGGGIDVVTTVPFTPEPTPSITLIPTSTPVVTVSPAPTPVVTPSPTPTPVVTASPTPSPEPVPESAVLRNEWYGPEMRYYYQFLTEHEKEVFDALYTAAVQHRSSAQTGYFTNEEFNHIYYVFSNDCPELFSLTFHVSYSHSSIDLNYRMDQAQYTRICSAIRSVFDTMAASFPAGGDEFEKQLVIYRYIIDHCDYLAAGDDSTAYADACLFNGKSQCSGYASALSLALRHFGIQSAVLSNPDHAWNLVRINGRWYNCDATWDDTGTDGIRIPYDPSQDEFNAWMNLPDRLYELNADHRPDHEAGFPVPAADSLQDSYAVRKASYIAAGAPDVAGSIDQCLDRAEQEGKHYVLIMLDDPSYVNSWDLICKRLYDVYNNYQWMFYGPDSSHRCMYAVPSGY